MLEEGFRIAGLIKCHISIEWLVTSSTQEPSPHTEVPWSSILIKYTQLHACGVVTFHICRHAKDIISTESGRLGQEIYPQVQLRGFAPQAFRRTRQGAPPPLSLHKTTTKERMGDAVEDHESSNHHPPFDNTDC